LARIDGRQILNLIDDFAESMGDSPSWPYDEVHKTLELSREQSDVLDLHSTEALESFSRLEVPRDAIEIKGVLGEGEFGVVEIGNLAVGAIKDQQVMNMVPMSFMQHLPLFYTLSRHFTYIYPNHIIYRSDFNIPISFPSHSNYQSQSKRAKSMQI
jgi:hypothetical protein